MSYIYAIKSKQTGKMYIGKTKQNWIKRWYRHTTDLNRGVSSCHILQRAWTKYGGKEAFEFILMAKGEFTGEELCQLEEIYIKLYGEYNILKISRSTNFSKSRNERIGAAHKALWSDPYYKKQRSESMRSHHWGKFKEVEQFWLDKNNGRGGTRHPGRVILQQYFNIPKGVIQHMILKLKEKYD